MQCCEILAIIEQQHDCNYGITWDTIEASINDYLYERE